MTLFELIEGGDLDSITKMKWSQSELDATDINGRTPLMLAAIRGDYRLAQVLKEYGADLNLRDSDGRKAVDLAALNGHGLVIAMLIEGGCGG